MANIDYTGKQTISAIWQKISALFVRKEYKTGSQSVYKVLSDNNLTDELVTKINNAGDSSFTGAYGDLTGKPSIEGNELATGNQTAASLGLATPSDITTATAGLASQTWVQGQGYQTASNVSDAVAEATSGMATQTWVQSQGYQDSEQVQSTVNAATAGMATQTWVNGQDFQTGSEVQAAIASAVSSTFTYKGNKDTVSELPQDGNKLGDVWFVTEDGAEYAWSGTEWEKLGGDVDMSAYVLHSEMVEIDSDYIDEVCQ